MPEWISLFDEMSGLTLKLFILVLVIVIKLLTNKLVYLDSFLYFRRYCQLLSGKVNKPKHSKSQLVTSGALAWAITVPPLAALVWSFDIFVDVIWLWQAFVLWLALGWLDTRALCKKIASALKKKHTEYAKEKLSPIVLRQTESLSSLGLSKASIEANLLRFNNEFATVIVLFFLLGPVTALAYRLTYEAHLAWNTRLHKYRYFGKPVTAICRLCQWPTSRILGLFYIVAYSRGQMMLMLRLTKGHFFTASSLYLIHAHALGLGITLGGPAFYEKEKVRRPVCNNTGRQPAQEDILFSIRSLDSITLFCLVLFVGSYVLLNLINTPIN